MKTRLRPELNCVDQGSDILIEALKKEYLRPPSDQVFKVWRPLLLSATRSMNIQGYNRTMIPSPSPSNKSSYFFSQYSQDQFLDRHVFKGKLKVSKQDQIELELGPSHEYIHHVCEWERLRGLRLKEKMALTKSLRMG